MSRGAVAHRGSEWPYPSGVGLGPFPSKKLGPLIFGEKDELVFLGKEIGEQRNYSEEIARQIDHEVRRIIESAYNKATQLINNNQSKLEEVGGLGKFGLFSKAKSIEDATGLSVEEFYELFQQNPDGACFETPRSIWESGY